MNKKMIALVVAGAMTAPVAMADVKVSGRVAFDLTDKGDVWNWSDSGHARLVFDGTAGDAYARLATDERFGRQNHDHAAGTAPGDTGETDVSNSIKRDQYVGYKLANGGKIQAGRMAGVAKNLEKDPYIATFLEVRGTSAMLGGSGAGKYGSSSFVSDVIQYSQKVGGVAVKVQYDPTDDGSGNDGHVGLSLKGKAGAVTWWLSTNDGAGDLGDDQNTKVGASMKFGNIKATLNIENNDNGTADVQRTFLMADIGLADGWSANVGYGTNDAVGDPTWTRLAVMKKLSKGASFYVGTVEDDASNGGDAETGVGMVVKF